MIQKKMENYMIPQIKVRLNIHYFPSNGFYILRSHFDWFHSNKNYYNYQFHHDTIFFVLIINFFIKQVNIHIFWSVILSLIESVDFGVLVHLYNMFYNNFLFKYSHQLIKWFLSSIGNGGMETKMKKVCKNGKMCGMCGM